MAWTTEPMPLSRGMTEQEPIASRASAERWTGQAAGATLIVAFAFMCIPFHGSEKGNVSIEGRHTGVNGQDQPVTATKRRP